MNRYLIVFLPLFCISCGNQPAPIQPASQPPTATGSSTPVERFAFKDYKLGMTYKSFLTTKPRITYSNIEEGTRSLFVDTSIGGIKTSCYLRFASYNSGLLLDYISITIKRSDWLAVQESLISKFGRPDSQRNITKSNALGAKWEGVEMDWDNGVSTLKAEELGKKFDESSIVFSAKGLGEIKGSQESRHKALKDI